MLELKELRSGINEEMLGLILDHIRLLRIHHAKGGDVIGLEGLQSKSESNSEMIMAASNQPLHQCDNSEACSSIQKEVMRLENFLFRYQALTGDGLTRIYMEEPAAVLLKDTMAIELEK